MRSARTEPPIRLRPLESSPVLMTSLPRSGLSCAREELRREAQEEDQDEDRHRECRTPFSKCKRTVSRKGLNDGKRSEVDRTPARGKGPWRAPMPRISDRRWMTPCTMQASARIATTTRHSPGRCTEAFTEPRAVPFYRAKQNVQICKGLQRLASRGLVCPDTFAEIGPSDRKQRRQKLPTETSGSDPHNRLSPGRCQQQRCSRTDETWQSELLPPNRRQGPPFR